MRSASVVCVCLCILITLAVCGCAPKSSPPAAGTPGLPPTAGTPAPTATTGVALGEQIAKTGTGESGQHIAFTGESERFASKPGGCVACHGEDGRGHKTGRGETPAINYTALRGGDKPLFPSDELVLRAIREGNDEAGKALAGAMPRWQLTDTEAAALLDYLKELDKAPASTEAKPAAPAS
jgi:mono/diheme cytochrome c family protein